MMLHVFVLLLLSFFMLYLAQLCHLYWSRHWFPHCKAVALHSTAHRLLKPRSPLDCPACRLSCTFSSGVVEPAPPPVRPWREVKSRRGAPKRVNRASESDHPPCNSRAGSSKLGDGSADPTPVRSPRVVACVLSFRASSPIPTSSAHAATRARGQTDCATLSPANSGDGSRQNTSTMDGARGALLPLAAGFRLRATTARGGCRVISRVDWYMCQQKHSDGASLREKKACLDCPMMKKPARNAFIVADRILHHVLWQHPLLRNSGFSERMYQVASTGHMLV
jgi:hypothetical protein